MEEEESRGGFFSSFVMESLEERLRRPLFCGVSRPDWREEKTTKRTGRGRKARDRRRRKSRISLKVFPSFFPPLEKYFFLLPSPSRRLLLPPTDRPTRPPLSTLQSTVEFANNVHCFPEVTMHKFVEIHGSKEKNIQMQKFKYRRKRREGEGGGGGKEDEVVREKKGEGEGGERGEACNG